MSDESDSLAAAVGNPGIEFLDREGLTASVLAKELKKKIHAKKVEVFKATKKIFNDAGFVTEQAEEVIYSKRLQALDIQLKALDMALKIGGYYPAERHELSGKNGQPMEHRIDSGEALRAVVDGLLGATKRGKPNGGSG